MPRIRRPQLSVANAMLALAALLVGIGTVWRVHLLGAGEADWDEGVYWASLRSIDLGHGIFSQTYSSQPPAFLGIVDLLWRPLGGTLASARLVIVASQVLGFAAIWSIARRFAGPIAAAAAVAIVAVDPLAVHESVTFQADAPSTWIGLAAIAVALSARRSTRFTAPWQRGALAALAGFLYANAVLVKLLAIAFAPAVLIAILLPAPTRAGAAGADKQAATESALRRGAGAALLPLTCFIAGGVIGTAIWIVPLLGSFATMVDQVVGGHVTARTSDVGPLNGVYATAERMIPTACIALAGLAVAWRRRAVDVWFYVAMIVPPVLFILWQRPIWPHHLVVLVPGFALAAAACIGRIADVRSRLIGAALVVVLALSAVFASAVSVNAQVDDLPPTDAAAELALATGPGAVVVSDDPYLASLAGLTLPPDLVDTSRVRISSGELEIDRLEADITASHASAVIFATDRLASIPGFRAWVRARYPHVTVTAFQQVYTR